MIVIDTAELAPDNLTLFYNLSEQNEPFVYRLTGFFCSRTIFNERQTRVQRPSLSNVVPRHVAGRAPEKSFLVSDWMFFFVCAYQITFLLSLRLKHLFINVYILWKDILQTSFSRKASQREPV